MFEALRAVTLHPAIVHVPLGCLPMVVVAYTMGAARVSERWMFAGDVALGVASLGALFAGVLGYVAYFNVEWPGGLGPWPIVHLALGTATVLAVAALAALRWRARRLVPERISKASWAVGSGLVTLLALMTGYVGGEILVFHGGIAVKGGAGGVLSPPLAVRDSSPASLHDAMDRLRPLWASCVTLTAAATVEGPSDATFDAVADHARRMQKLARWLYDWGGAQRGLAAESPTKATTDAERSERRSRLQRLARGLGDSTFQLEQAAIQRKLPELVTALAATTNSCIECHQHASWQANPTN